MSPYEWFAVVAGLVIVAGTSVSVVKTLVVPRRAWSLVPRTVEAATTWVFMTIARRFRSYDPIDRFLGFLGPTVLILTLLVWLGLFVAGFALLLVPSTDTFSLALAHSGSSTFTLGISSREPGATSAIDVAAGAVGLIVIALTIAYLPALYSVVRRRETLAKQLENRAGSPAWGPQILRAHMEADALPVLPGLYADWDRWASEVSDGHTKYPVLNYFRLPRSRHHWLLSLVAMMDAAALDLSVRTSAPPEARLFLLSGVACIDDLATSLHISVGAERGIEVTEDDFTSEVTRLAQHGYPCDERTADAWASFSARRAAYAEAACRILDTIVAPDAPWTNGRSLPTHR